MNSARPGRRASAREDGIAMITALAVVSIVFLLSVVVAQLAFHDQSTTRLDRSRTQAITAAEAGLDLAMEKAGDDATLPCAAADLNGQIASGSTKTDYTVTVAYYGTYPVSGSPLTCTDIAGGVIPKAALITSVGSVPGVGSTLAKRRVESLVKLTAVPSNAFNKAIFADNSLNFSNSAHILGNVGSDANVYSNAMINCVNSIHIEGSVVTQQQAQLANSCHIDNDLRAKGYISMVNSAKVGGNAVSSTSYITLDHSAEISKDATAAGTITTGGSSKILGSRFASTATAAPTVETLPVIPWNATVSAEWAAKGFEIVNWTGACGVDHKTSPTGVYAKVYEMQTATQPRVIYTTCQLNFVNNTDVFLAKDLVVFSTGGFNTANSTKVIRTGTDPTPRRLYWIVPSPNTCTGGLGNINLTNSTQFTTIETFFYTPCLYNGNNSAHFVGQVYAKDVNITNSYELSYVPLPVYGATGGGGVERYQVDPVYKREDRAS